ncbi:MAG: hypothetical protein PHT19_10400 [Methylococcus sp.]|nr:hypothetical protein [Methylococcus sp.]
MSFATELLRGIQDEAARKHALRVLGRYAGRMIYVPSLHRETRLAACRSMLAAGFSRSEAAEALVGRYSISKSTAYRVVAKAIKTMT